MKSLLFGCSVVSDCDCKDCSVPGKNTGVGCHFLLQVIEPVSPESPALAGGFFTTEPPGKPCQMQLLQTKSGHTHLFTYAYEYSGSSSTVGVEISIDGPTNRVSDSVDGGEVWGAV